MPSINEYVGELIVAGGGVATSILAWKQGQSKAKTSHLDNVEKAIKIWEDTSNKLRDSLTTLEDEMKVMRSNHEECESSKRELSEKVKVLEDAMHGIIGTPKDKQKPLNEGK
jgi:predicted  nucleic acid-binding Zn-ribbon protein